MFFKISKSARDEIVSMFGTSGLEHVRYISEAEVIQNPVSAFESASLSFGKPLILPSISKVQSVKVASDFPVAKPADIYTLASEEKIAAITQEIDSGLFVSNSKSVNWNRSGKYNACNWDVKKLMMTLRSSGPMNTYQINMALPRMDRYRISAILRELRKQGILVVN